jgi:Carboxypeptidase regulatory-like domain
MGVVVTGFGWISGNGFDATYGTWAFSTQNPGVGNPTRFSFDASGGFSPTVSISGTVIYCSGNPMPNVTLTRNGTTSGSTLSDGSGNYTFSFLPSGGNYLVTPTKTARAPGSTGIDTVDVIATQRQFLGLGTPLSGCRLTAADVNSDTSINTQDVIAIQRFALGFTSGIANTGRYQFTPANRTYPGVVTDQTGQNYDIGLRRRRW